MVKDPKELEADTKRSFWQRIHNRWDKWRNPKTDEEKNTEMKQKAVFQMSGNHILNYILKKKPSV